MARTTVVIVAAGIAVGILAVPARAVAGEAGSAGAATGNAATERHRAPVRPMHGPRPWPGYAAGWYWGFGAGFPWWGYGAVLPGYLHPPPRTRTETIYVNPVPMPRFGTGPAPAAGRWYCPASGLYYPQANACAQPWMEVSEPDPLPPEERPSPLAPPVDPAAPPPVGR